MLAGTAALAALGRRAPRLDALDGEALTLPGVELLQVTYELAGAAPEALFPPGLPPTLPVLAVLALWRADAGPLGRFGLAQLRLSCRSGVRPRQLLVASFAEGEPARAALNARFGFGARPAKVRLERFYDPVEGGGLVGGRAAPDVSAQAPPPLPAGGRAVFSCLP